MWMGSADNELELFVGGRRVLVVGRLRQLLACIVATTLFCLAAYASRYFNTAFMHDSLEIVSNQTSFNWQIGLGRWLQPMLWAVRGNINAPWLLGLVSIPFFALASWLITDVLRIEDVVSSVCVSAIIVTAMPIALGHATFMPWVDVYAISLFLAVLAVWLCVRSRYWHLAVLPLVGSLALYQSYLQFFTGLSVLALMRCCFDKRTDIRMTGGLLAKMLFVLLIGLGIYWFSTVLATQVTGIEKVDSYNGISEVGAYDGGIKQVLLLLLDAWRFPFLWFWGATGLIRRLLALALGIVALVLAFNKVRFLPTEKKALFVVLLVVFPFAINIVYVISKGMEHDLMVHSFYLAYVLPLMLIDVAGDERKGESAFRFAFNKTERSLRVGMTFATCILMIISLLSVRYANQIMLERQLEYESTHVIMARVIDRMELTEGYVPGQTPVAFIGSPGDAVLHGREGFPEPRWGMKYLTGLTYSNPYRWYFETVLGYPINLAPNNDIRNTSEVLSMGAFPAKDSVRMVDNMLVVKFVDE